MKGFVESNVGPYAVWQFKPWIDAGIVHGFTGSSGDFSNSNLTVELPRFLSAFNLHDLLLPTQVHGTSAADLRMNEDTGVVFPCEADATVAMRGDGRSCAIGVRTADCLPVILKDSSQVAVIHAGWRGLSMGILEEVLKMGFNLKTCEALIGPCAGKESYEVGAEVIDAFGEKVIATRTSSDKFHLSLNETAAAILESAGIQRAEIHILDICTITDARFHSFRRQKDKRGSNCCFVVI